MSCSDQHGSGTPSNGGNGMNEEENLEPALQQQGEMSPATGTLCALLDSMQENQSSVRPVAQFQKSGDSKKFLNAVTRFTSSEIKIQANN
jgi:hypothetical protein